MWDDEYYDPEVYSTDYYYENECMNLLTPEKAVLVDENGQLSFRFMGEGGKC